MQIYELMFAMSFMCFYRKYLFEAWYYLFIIIVLLKEFSG